MLKTVFFDIGNVLLFFSHAKLLQQTAVCTGLEVPEIKKLLFDTNLRERYEKGKVNTEELYRVFSAVAKKPFSKQEMTDSLSNIFTPNLALWPLVEQLQKNGIRLVLLSNTSECHFNYAVARYPIFQLFHAQILSYKVGAWKPDPLIFKTALQHAHCKEEECFYTDDIPEFILAARKIGLSGAVFTDVPRLKQDLIDRGCCFLT